MRGGRRGGVDLEAWWGGSLTGNVGCMAYLEVWGVCNLLGSVDIMRPTWKCAK